MTQNYYFILERDKGMYRSSIGAGISWTSNKNHAWKFPTRARAEAEKMRGEKVLEVEGGYP